MMRRMLCRALGGVRRGDAGGAVRFSSAKPTEEDHEAYMAAVEEKLVTVRSMLKKQLYDDPEGASVVHLQSRLGDLLLRRGTEQSAREGVESIRKGLVLQEKIEPGTESLVKGYNLAANVYADLGELDEAVACLTKASDILRPLSLEEDSTLALFFTVHQRLTGLLAMRGDFDASAAAARGLFNTLARSAKSEANFKELRGMMCNTALMFQKQGARDETREFFESALALSEAQGFTDDELPHIYYLLATMDFHSAADIEDVAKRGVMVDRAGTACAKGLTLFPDVPVGPSDALGKAVMLNLMANVHLVKEEAAEAVATAKQALALLDEYDKEDALVPEKFKALVTLGEVLEAAGDSEAAAQYKERGTAYFSIMREAEEKELAEMEAAQNAENTAKTA